MSNVLIFFYYGNIGFKIKVKREEGQGVKGFFKLLYKLSILVVGIRDVGILNQVCYFIFFFLRYRENYVWGFFICIFIFLIKMQVYRNWISCRLFVLTFVIFFCIIDLGFMLLIEVYIELR